MKFSIVASGSLLLVTAVVAEPLPGMHRSQTLRKNWSNTLQFMPFRSLLHKKTIAHRPAPTSPIPLLPCLYLQAMVHQSTLHRHTVLRHPTALLRSAMAPVALLRASPTPPSLLRTPPSLQSIARAFRFPATTVLSLRRRRLRRAHLSAPPTAAPFHSLP